VCFYAAPFGVIPLELDEVYPLSQHETTVPLDQEAIHYVACQVADYVKRSPYKVVALLHDQEIWGTTVKNQCRSACNKKNVSFEWLGVHGEASKEILSRLELILKKNLSE
jgi:predicted RNA-binding protein